MKFSLPILLCIISLNVNAQSWVENNATWHYDFVDTNGYFGYYVVSHIDDTVLYGHSAQIYETKILPFFNFGPGPYDIGYFGEYSSTGIVMYSDSDKVYVPSETIGGWRTLLDFSAQINDSWWFDDYQFGPICSDSSGVIVTGTGISNILGVDYRYIDLEPIPGSQKVLEGRFYERFGGDFFIPHMTANCDGNPAIDDDIYNLRCFQDDSLVMNFVSEDCEYHLTHLGINELSKSLEIYPNPTNGIIQFSGSIVSEIQIVSIEGLVLKTLKVPNKQTIDLTDLPKGTFFLKCVTNDNIIVKRIILQH